MKARHKLVALAQRINVPEEADKMEAEIRRFIEQPQEHRKAIITELLGRKWSKDDIKAVLSSLNRNTVFKLLRFK